MRNLLDLLTEKANHHYCGHASVEANSGILKNIEIMTNGHGHSEKREKQSDLVEVWLHCFRPLENNCSEYECILEHNEIPEDEIHYNGCYDYHLSYFPLAWLADIMPKLLSDSGKTKHAQPVEQMLTTALNSGYYVMDMETMNVYSL